MERSVPIYKICHIRSPAGLKERQSGGEEGGSARSVSDLTEEYNILYVFYGNVEFLSDEGGVVNINDLFIQERENPFFKSIFSEYELQSIIHNEIKVVFLPERIYPDDSIETIKKKFLYLTREKVGLSYAELYLFCKQAKTITSQLCYDQITSNGKLEITPVRIQNFLLNIDNHPRESVNYGGGGGADALTEEAPDFTKLGAPSESDGNYSYTNILNLKLEGKPRFVNVVLGQELSAVSDGYPYAINPFDAIYTDPFLEVHAGEIINTTNKTVLIDIGVFLHNTIYLVSAGDVLQYAKSLEDPSTLAELGIPVTLPPIGAAAGASAPAAPAQLLRLITENYIVQLYFPYLAVYRDDTKRLSLELGSAEASGEMDLSTIHSHNTLLLHRLKLVESDKKILNERFMRQTANIKLLYDIYEKRTREHAYSDNGIRGVEFHIHQSAKYNLSLDAIFKLIHCSEYIPFIKYNPGKKMDNIYKLYISGVSKSGRKIPYLPKGDIFRLIKTTARKKGVSILIQYTYSNPSIPDHKATHLPIPIICEFDADGSVYVKLFVKFSFTTEEMEDIIRATVNPVMRVVKEYIEQSGFQMNLFTKFTHDNIDLINVEYYAQLPIKRNIEIKSMIKCISSAFNEIEGSLNKGIVLRYKRVSNYNDMTSQEAYIIEMMNKRHTDREIIDGLRDNYMMSEEDARTKIVTLLSSIQTQQMSRYRGGSIRIKNNPGFLTKITKGQFNNIITIEISNINNILFLTSLHIYIDSIIRVYQDPSTTDIPYEQIIQLCQGETKSTGAAAVGAAVAPVAPPLREEAPGESSGGERDYTTQPILRDVNPSDKEESIETMTEIVSLSRKPISESVTSTILGEKLVFGFEAEEAGAAGGGGGGAGGAGEGGIDLFDLLQDDDEDEDEGGEDEGDQFGGAGGAAKGRPSGGGGEAADDDKRGPRSAIGGEGADDSLSDITGLELANPNPFSKRIQERDPIIHLNEDVGKFNAYSRSCPWNVRRQPVILTSEEKARIDREHPNSYSQSITYGSDQSKQYHYICPRYWSLKHNTSLTEEEVKSGKYGKVIPQKAKKVPAGASIFEFTDDKYHLDEKGNYKPHYPGFLKKDAHPKGLCVPCCFGQWDKPSQTARRQECEMKQHEEIRIKEKDKLEEFRQLSASGSAPGSGSSSAPSASTPAIPEVAKITEMKDDRILSSDKFPLDNNRWGYLPVPIQKFLFSDSRNCQVSLKNTAIKKDTPCLLRRGVETNDKQSFLSAVAYYYKECIGSIKTTVSDITPDVMTTTSVATHKSIDDIITGASAAVAGGGRAAAGGGGGGGGGMSLKDMISKSVAESINKQSAQIRSAASAGSTRSNVEVPIASTGAGAPINDEYQSDDETPVAMTPRAGGASSGAASAMTPRAANATAATAATAASNTGDTVPSIREMRRIIIGSLDIDRFITLQNGTLVDVFFNKTRELRENDTTKYQTSQIYRQFNPELFRKICNAYENFISYLDDDNVIIDHTYLWDIVSQPNERLFKNGNNLILLHIPDDDITNNVQVICPTNAYSGEVFDANRKTVIIMKRDKYYEPIYLFESKSNGKFNVLGRFAIKSKTITPKIKYVIENIRDIYFTYCRLHASQPRQYKYVMNKPAKQVVKLLTDAGFQIRSQVVNYNGKVIGLHISQTVTAAESKIKQTKTVPKETARKMWEGVIPTAVSAPLIATAGAAGVAGAYEYPIVMMDNDDLWRNSYNETVEFLNMVADKVKKMTKQILNCRPKVKVVEDGLIVGVLTETNQFIQVNVNVDPAQNQDDELPTITEGNHLKVDKEIMTSSSLEGDNNPEGRDKSREKYVRNIRLETNFYNVFRNTARNVLNRPENRAIRDEIDKIISSVFTIYTNKLSKVIALMKQIMNKYVAFIRYSKETLKLVGEVSSCITTDHEKCGQKSYCLKEGGGLCKLLLPQRNLMYPDIDNQIAYFGKLSDEMIRYERVKLFMFEPAKYLTFQEIKYNLNDDEIILLESLITQEYFDNLEPVDANPYALQTTFYTVNPNSNTGVELQRYDNTYRKSYVDGYIESSRGVAPSAAPELPVAASASASASVSGVERFKANEITHVLGFCNDISKRKVTEKMRQLFFPVEDTYEILFSNESEECSFDVILTILRAVAQTASKCPSGHTCNRMKQLERRGAAGGGGGAAAEDQDACGKCRTMIGKDQTEFGCLQCNYFVCDNCQHQHVDQLGGMNIIKLKEILVSEYGKLSRTPAFDKKITRVLNGYGMKKYAELITSGRVTLSQVIQSQNYFLTNVDIWILALYFKLPIAFISQSLLIENGRNLMVLYGNDTLESYFFIHPFGVTQNVISRFGLIEKKLDEETSVLKIPSDYLSDGLREMIVRELDEPKSLEQYISDFKLGDVKTKGRPTLVMRKAEGVPVIPGDQPEPEP
jgi:hypothetical protein